MQQSTHLLSWSLLLPALAVLLLTFKLGQRYLALRHIPGPRLAAWTDLWLLIQRWSGRNELELLATLGQTYGPLVRYGPKRVLFSNPKLVATVYGTTKPYDKVGRIEQRFVERVTDMFRVHSMKYPGSK